MKCATKVESRKFTESHDTVKAFCGCGLGWKNRRFLLNVVLALRMPALESSAHFVDAQAHTMGRRRILRMRMSKCSVKFLLNWAKPRLYALCRRVAAKASCPTPSLRSIGRPVCYIESATHGALLLLVRSTFMCSPHSPSISTLRSGVERYLIVCRQASGSLHLCQDITYCCWWGP